MNVGSVNSIGFRGSISETDNGNEYEKFNGGKKYLTLAHAGLTAVTSTVLSNNKNLNISLKRNGLDATQRVKAKTGGIAFLIAVAALSGLITGAIIDACVNNRRRKDVDKAVYKQEVKQNTNKGKIVCGLIFAGIGALSALSTKKILPLLTSTGWGIITGSVYDHGVNKNRKELSAKLKNNELGKPSTNKEVKPGANE